MRPRLRLRLAVLAALAPAAWPQVVAERAVEPASGHTYLRTGEPLTFFEAEAVARAAGCALVSIGSAEEETFLLENFGASEPYWIGLEFPREAWASGEPVPFTHWSPGEPTGATDEPYTLMNWSAPGSWGDTDGDVGTVRCRALLEFPKGIAPPALAAPPALPPQRGVLLVAIQDLVGKDLESPKNASLFQLWKGSAWTHGASGDGSNDPLANLGMVLWGVGSSRSRLTSANAKAAAHDRNTDLLTRLERAHPSISSAALLDDPALAGVLLGGRIDVRASNTSARKGGAPGPLADALALPAPACLVVTFTNAVAPGATAPSEPERVKDIAAIDKELGALLAALRARPGYAAEEWLIVVCGLELPASRTTKDTTETEAASVPLVLVGSPLPAGEILGEFSLTDVLPAAYAHLGLATRRSWALDGLVPWRAATLGTNLVANGGAEAQFGWPDGQFPKTSGWRSLGGFRTARHDAASTGPPTRGQSYFRGGPELVAGLDQCIDLRALSPAIERGLRFRLSGWLGAGQDSGVTVEVALEFRSEQRKTLERVPLGPLEPGKRPKAAPPAGLIEYQASGRVPKRARAARLVLLASGPKGTEGAMADEFSLVLEED
jgi:hypothetical protein